MLLFVNLLFSCKKSDSQTKSPDTPDKVMNGINVNIATSAFNAYRTQGIPGYPGVAAITWNDTLSNAAYNFAKAKTEDGNASSSTYSLSNGQFILDFPGILHYSGTANFALFYGYPANTDVKTVVNSGFTSNDQTVLNGLMSSTTKQFGMAQFGEKWYVIMAD